MQDNDAAEPPTLYLVVPVKSVEDEKPSTLPSLNALEAEEAAAEEPATVAKQRKKDLAKVKKEAKQNDVERRESLAKIRSGEQKK